jgi:hypothetical protein
MRGALPGSGIEDELERRLLWSDCRRVVVVLGSVPGSAAAEADDAANISHGQKAGLASIEYDKQTGLYNTTGW